MGWEKGPRISPPHPYIDFSYCVLLWETYFYQSRETLRWFCVDVVGQTTIEAGVGRYDLNNNIWLSKYWTSLLMPVHVKPQYINSILVVIIRIIICTCMYYVHVCITTPYKAVLLLHSCFIHNCLHLIRAFFRFTMLVSAYRSQCY